MPKSKRNFGALLAATVLLLGGILTLQSGTVDYFGVTGFDGRQAQAFGWISIGFAVVVFVAYLRGSQND